MRAVWSFWSKPFKAFKGRIWREPHHHLLAWGLSLRLARRHFSETQLITDSPGKSMLVDELGLEFDHVSTELDELHNADEGWWALGKIVAYSVQEQPFVHLDTDVFLWKALPSSLLSAPVLAQCPEHHPSENAWCGPRHIEWLFDRHRLSLPVEWQWAASRSASHFREENCGILGGNRVDFLRHFARTAIQLVTDPLHQEMWSKLPEKSGFNMIIEQFLLAACIDYHRHNPQSPFRGVQVRYLFPTWSEAFNPHSTTRAGFTHLLGDAKNNPSVVARLEDRVNQLDPAFLRHCRRIAQSPAIMGA